MEITDERSRALVCFKTVLPGDLDENTAIDVSIDIEEEIPELNIVAFLVDERSTGKKVTFASDSKYSTKESVALLNEYGKHTFSVFANLLFVSGYCEIVLDVCRNDTGLSITAYNGTKMQVTD